MRPGGGAGGGNGAGMQQSLAMLQQAAERLTVSQNDSTVTFASDEGGPRVFRTNGKAIKEGDRHELSAGAEVLLGRHHSVPLQE